MEGAPHLHGGEVGGQVEAVGRVGAVEDEVEGGGVGGLPAGLAGADEVVGAQRARVGLFAGRVGDYVHGGAEGDGEEDGEVPEAAAGLGWGVLVRWSGCAGGGG